MTEQTNVIPLLPQRVENAIKERLKRRALERCDVQIAQYAQCTQTKTISALWSCRPFLLEMKACTAKYTSETEVNKLRLAYDELQRYRELEQNNQGNLDD